VKRKPLDRNNGFTFEVLQTPDKEDNDHLRQHTDSKEGNKHGKEERQQDADPKNASIEAPESSEHEPT